MLALVLAVAAASSHLRGRRLLRAAILSHQAACSALPPSYPLPLGLRLPSSDLEEERRWREMREEAAAGER
nr:unnamed protein product [Digitaria exilis]